MSANLIVNGNLKMVKIVCFLMFYLSSCNDTAHKILIDNSVPLKIDLQKNSSVEIKGFTNQLLNPEIIPLRNKDTSFFIASIKKMMIYNNDYYILDNRFSTLSRFDHTGNFMMSYGTIGLGRDEYRKISDFDIDTLNNYIVIFSSTNNYFYYYALQTGIFIKKIYTGIYGSQFCIIPGNQSLLYRNFSADDKCRDYNMISLDGKGKVSGVTFPFDPKISAVAWESTGFLKNCAGKILYANAFSDTVYEFSDNVFKPFIEIGITSENIKANHFNHRKLLSTNILLDSSASLLGSEFLCNRDFIVFNYQANRKINTSIYNIHSKQLYTISSDSIADPFILFFLTPVFLDTKNNLYFKFDMKDVLTVKRKDPDIFDKLGKANKDIMSIQKQYSGAFLLRVKINNNPTLN